MKLPRNFAARVPAFDDQKLSLHVTPLQDDDVRNVRRTLLLLFGGVALYY